ncbi:MAG: hypothetical protein JNM27_11365 [Leptospirales bacterium]|nr:hypothetical protein [Leptospirales bacterium]
MLLTVDERKHLAELKRKMKNVRAVVRGVVTGFHTGLILSGEGGTAKSYNVIQELKSCRAEFKHHQGRVTARGLFDTLARFPAMIHLIEDAESMYRNAQFTGLMRNALHSQDQGIHPLRILNWITSEGCREVSFTEECSPARSAGRSANSFKRSCRI